MRFPDPAATTTAYRLYPILKKETPINKSGLPDIQILLFHKFLSKEGVPFIAKNKRVNTLAQVVG
jgi:hypothetical protein